MTVSLPLVFVLGVIAWAANNFLGVRAGTYAPLAAPRSSYWRRSCSAGALGN